ncbi:uncharacterized protein LOC130673411 [Microplitis mediator]|uniref:uncharacterized protein LOC130673411 n=1 Tax=Microplitis mediator TaxID=375433 RepID=UPI0025559858|nr:uncharacterized protein LOC130673411 [Microplitis mediator]
MNNQTMLYTLNPFTHRAPYPWIEIEGIEVEDPRIALYGQPFINDKMLCDALNFDKTQFLDGYNVTISTLGDHFLQKYVFPSLNMTPIHKYEVGAETYLFANRFQDISGTLSSFDFVDTRYVDLVSGVVESNFAIVTKKEVFCHYLIKLLVYLMLEILLH